MIKLSIVLISKNQDWNIERLVKSVLDQTTNINQAEILLVDSASIDSTVKKACKFPINVLRLSADQLLTPSAGRYIGLKYAKGDFILFLDGDMELYDGWLKKAIQIFEKSPEIAVVTGDLINLPKTTGLDKKPPHFKTDSDTVVEVPYARGAAMYRRSVLDKVRQFNPFLHSDEEPELCISLRCAGYQVIQVKYPIAYHYSDPDGALSTMIKRWKRKLYFGAGQSLRYHLGDDMFWPYFKERGYACLPGIVIIAGLMSIITFFISGYSIWIYCIAFILAIVIIGDAYRKRSFYKTIASLLHRSLILYGTIRGFLMTPLPQDNYPEKVEIVRQLNK